MQEKYDKIWTSRSTKLGIPQVEGERAALQRGDQADPEFPRVLGPPRVLEVARLLLPRFHRERTPFEVNLEVNFRHGSHPRCRCGLTA